MRSPLFPSVSGQAVFDGTAISRILNPREFFSDPALSPEHRDRLFAEFHRVAAKGFGVPFEEKSEDGVRNHVVEADGLFVLHNQSSVLGFASTRHLWEVGSLYLHGIVLDSSVQGRGFSRALMEYAVSSRPASLRVLGFTTQNPVMFCLGRSIVRDRKIYPSPQNPTLSPQLRPFGKLLVPEDDIHPETFVIRERYSVCLYPKIPESRDWEVNRWFASSLEIRDGQTRHGFLFIGNL